MKFSCNSCNTKYNLPDEKFAGKVITLTCKRCGAKIVVRPERQQTSSKTITEPERKLVQDSLEKRKTEPSLLKMPQVDRPSPYIKSPKLEGESLKKEQSIKESQPSRKRGEPAKRSIQQEEMKKNQEKGVEKGEETSAEKTEVESEGWYFSRGGQQKGPFTDDEIKELVENNVITPKTFVWKDGMMDWMKAGTCAEFKHFFDKETESEKKEKNAIESLGLDELDKKFGEKEEEPQKKSADDRMDEAKDKNIEEDFFSKEVEQPVKKSIEEETDWTKIPSTDEASEAPRENTRIVIMKAGLSESAKRKRVLIRIMMAIVLLGVFIFVFIRNLGPILSAVGVQIKSGIDLEMEDMDKDTLSKMTPEERERYKKALLGIKETKKLTKEQKRSIAMAITQKKETDLASILENAKVEGGNIIYENLGRDRLGAAGGQGVNLDLNSKLQNLGINAKIEGVDLSSKVKREDLDLSSKMPDKVDKLSEDIIMAVINKNRGSVKYCYERHLKASSSLEGKAIFRIYIQNSGSVSRVDSLSKQISGSLFEECIIKEIKKWVFPKFSGDPIAFEVPFVLTSLN
ncbi:MAG: AgmX/PglI C-terminal domain-containing protein [Myxococcota bacterium]